MAKKPIDFQIENESYAVENHDEIQDQMNKDGMLKLYGNDLDTFTTMHQDDIANRQAFEENNPGEEVPASMKVAKYEYPEAFAADPDSPEAQAADRAEPEDMVVNMDDVMDTYNKYLNPDGEPFDLEDVNPIKLGYDGHGEARAHQAEAERVNGENVFGDEAEAKAHPTPEMPDDVRVEVDKIVNDQGFDFGLDDLSKEDDLTK